MAHLPGENEYIEADLSDDDADSTLGSELASETTSLNSLVLQFEYENGRRYHSYKSGAYAFPNDEAELDRMNFEHHIFGLLLDGLHLAPLVNPQRILDIGTGTGIWAIEMADKYPSATVIGTDLSPVQPSLVPPNCQFEIDDFEQEWTFQPGTADLIHSRLVLASVSDYPRLFQQALNHLKPGGYMEMHDIDPGFYSDDDTVPKESSASRWSDLFFEACEKIGRKIPKANEYASIMKDAGFVDVHAKILKRPSNIWPKDKTLRRIGMYTLANHVNGLHAFTIGPFTRTLGWSPTEVEIFLAHCRREWRDKSIHAYQKVIAVYGMKPK